ASIWMSMYRPTFIHLLNMPVAVRRPHLEELAMSTAQRVFHGKFGRVALLDMDQALVTHSHHECHVLVKAAGADTFFNVNGHQVPLTDRSAVLVNAWQPHFYDY